MGFCYKPLWKMLIDKDMTKKVFRENVGISKSTIDKMGRSEYVSLEVIDKICNYFNCEINDIMKHINDEEKK